ncbi:MAG: dehydrogenase [Erythrobacter sp.]|nr:dehydrogenase [Erythrobacter sp.]
MPSFTRSALNLSLVPFMLASCGATTDVDSGDAAIAVEERSTFDMPWAATFVPGTQILVVTEKAGNIRGYDTSAGRRFEIAGAPQVDFGGQGGLGDVAFLPSESAETVGSRTIYLSWAEAGEEGTRGAAVGRGKLECSPEMSCAVRDLAVIWRQTPKVTGRGHYSHRLTFSPDGQYLFVTSGDRQKFDPAQDTSNTLGSIVRLNLDGSPAAGNPLADAGAPSNQIWSFGHRNMLGIGWDAQGRLWAMEHGPDGGDEFNLIEPGQNYGWPVVSNGNHYDGKPIPDHPTRPEFAAPAISWTPVIAPGGMIFYRGDLFAGWKGDALIAGLGAQGLVQVRIEGDSAREVARHDLGNRIRAVVEAPDGALWVLEDGPGGRLLRLTPG